MILRKGSVSVKRRFVRSVVESVELRWRRIRDRVGILRFIFFLRIYSSFWFLIFIFVFLILFWVLLVLRVMGFYFCFF